MLRIYTYSIVYSAAEQFQDRTPYCSAILEDETGARFAALLADYADGMEVQIGQAVYPVSAAEGTPDEYCLSKPEYA